MRTIRALLSAAVLLASSVYADDSSAAAAPALRGTVLSIDLNSTAVSVQHVEGDKLSMGFYAEGGDGQHPENARDAGGKIALTVRPYQEAVQVTNGAYYTSGTFAFRVKSAATAPGIITAVYVSSGQGRRGDAGTGNQDEIDLEWKGNDPSTVQTNVFVDGQEDIQVIGVGNSAASERLYAIRWEPNAITFSIDGAPVRTKALFKPLKPMKLNIAVWTTSGGWPGLISWAGGPPDWDHMAVKEATATFEIVQLPNA